jgi:hypothetical protein
MPRSPGWSDPETCGQLERTDPGLEGTVESEIEGDETGTFRPGTAFQIPANVKRRTANTGEGTARLVLYFDSAKNVVTLDDPMMSMDSKVL